MRAETKETRRIRRVDLPSLGAEVLLEESVDRIDGGEEPLLTSPEGMGALGHEDELIGYLVGVEPFAKVDVAHLGPIELAVDKKVGRRMFADVGEGRCLLVDCFVLGRQVAPEKIDH